LLGAPFDEYLRTLEGEWPVGSLAAHAHTLCQRPAVVAAATAHPCQSASTPPGGRGWVDRSVGWEGTGFWLWWRVQLALTPSLHALMRCPSGCSRQHGRRCAGWDECEAARGSCVSAGG
jgi:hypothetical protein